MTFLAPFALAGLVALSIPVAIHLLNKFRVKEVRWAAMAFLKASVAKNQRRIKLADLLLLVLRCLLVALLALAFARPTLDSSLADAAGSGESRHVMVLLDHSASMGQSDGAETRFEIARREALLFLEKLGANSAAGLLLVSDTSTPSVPRPSTNLALVRRSVELARLSDRGSDFLPAIKQAFEALKKLQGAREIVFFTDNQALGWNQLAAVKALMSENPSIPLRLVPAGTAGEPNLAITDIDLDGAWPSPNTPVRVMVEVRNHTAEPVDGVRLTLAVNDEPASGETLIQQLAPGGSRRFPIIVQFPAPGTHLLTATLPPDRLASDNQRAFALRVSPPQSTLVIETRRQLSLLGGSGLFLSQALSPVDPSDSDAHYLQPVTRTAQQVDVADLDNYDVIFLCDAEPLKPDVLAALPAFVKRGGGLVVFPGASTSPEDYSQAPWNELLPALPAAPAEGVFSWETPPYAHPLLSLWNDPANGSLRTVKAVRIMPLVVSTATGGEIGEPSVVLRLDTREPAIMERRFGSGRVVLFNFNPTPDWTNLSLHPAFVALVHRLYAHVTPRPAEQLNLSPAQPFLRELGIALAKKDVFLAAPGVREPTSVGRTELGDGNAILRVSDTEAVGGYRVYLDRSAPPEIVFAIQSPASEANLAVAPSDILTRDPAAVGESSETTATSRTRAPWVPGATQLWLSLVILALVVSVAELVLSLRASRAIA